MHQRQYEYWGGPWDGRPAGPPLVGRFRYVAQGRRIAEGCYEWNEDTLRWEWTCSPASSPA